MNIKYALKIEGVWGIDWNASIGDTTVQEILNPTSLGYAYPVGTAMLVDTDGNIKPALECLKDETAFDNYKFLGIILDNPENPSVINKGDFVALGGSGVVIGLSGLIKLKKGQYEVKDYSGNSLEYKVGDTIYVGKVALTKNQWASDVPAVGIVIDVMGDEIVVLLK